MRTINLKGYALMTALLTSLMILVGVGNVFAAHDPVTLKNHLGTDIAVTANPDGMTAAYSVQATCGGCHDYDSIEQHSYHAQIGANQWVGWSPWNPTDSASSFKRGVGAKGKNWVQSPGHLGKW